MSKNNFSSYGNEASWVWERPPLLSKTSVCSHALFYMVSKGRKLVVPCIQYKIRYIKFVWELGMGRVYHQMKSEVLQGNGNPLQYSCLANPMDGGAWWAAVHGVSRSQTRLHFHFHFSLSCTGEGNGNPPQCSCLENPRDRGAWWAAVYGVAQSRTRPKWLSGSSSRSSSSIVSAS